MRPKLLHRSAWAPGRDQLQLLATMLDGGVRIDDGLELLARSSPDRPTRAGASAAAADVRAGRGLGPTLESCGAPRYVTAAIAAGEQSGRVSDALRAAAALSGDLDRLHASIRRALVYPALVLTIGLVMTVVIATAVVPTFERTFRELNGTLPAATRIVLESSAFLRSPPTLATAVGAALVIGAIRRRSGAPSAASVVMIPLFGNAMEDLDVAILSTLVATQLRSSITFDAALEAAADAIGHPERRHAVLDAAERVRSGRGGIGVDGLGDILRPIERELLTVAERTGGLAEQWMRVAELRQQRLDGRVARIASVLEPILVLVVGAMVGAIILSLYLPTFRIVDLL